MTKSRVLVVPSSSDPTMAKPRAPALKYGDTILKSSLHATVDMVFVIDTTGSMSDKIDGVIRTCEDFVHSFSQLRLKHRVAVVGFGDLTVPGDKIVQTPFMENTRQIQEMLRKIPRFSGGGNEGESSLEALNEVLAMPYREGAVRVCVLITDEPALQHNLKAEIISRRLRQSKMIAYVVAPPLDYFKSMAETTGGGWLQVTSSADFSSLLAMLRGLAKTVASVVSDVHLLCGGDVTKYLQLGKPKRD